MTFDPDAPAALDSGPYGAGRHPADAATWLIPVPVDVTTSYRAGASGGPDAVLAASQQVELRDLDAGEPWLDGLAWIDAPPWLLQGHAAVVAASAPLREAHDVAVDPARLGPLAAEVDAFLDRVHDHVEELATAAFTESRLPVVVGGDHCAPLGLLRASARHHAGLGVLHLDAHADLRVAYQGYRNSHASILHNVLAQADVHTLVQVGLRDVGGRELDRIETDPRIQAFFDRDLRRARHAGTPWIHTCRRIVEALPQRVHVTFDVDALDPAFCPHTGTPVPGGLHYDEVVTLLEVLVHSGRRIVSLDLCEVAPDPASDDGGWDANVGARLLYKLVGFALRSRR